MRNLFIATMLVFSVVGCHEDDCDEAVVAEEEVAEEESDAAEEEADAEEEEAADEGEEAEESEEEAEEEEVFGMSTNGRNMLVRALLDQTLI